MTKLNCLPGGKIGQTGDKYLLSAESFSDLTNPGIYLTLYYNLEIFNMKIRCCLTGVLILLFCYSCTKSGLNDEVVNIEIPDWSDATHGKTVEPDYSMVFPQDKVQKLDLVISSTDWAAIQSDLAGMPRTAPGATIEGSFDPIWVTCALKYNGKEWYKVGIRVKGNSSLQTTVASGIKKYSFKIDFDQFEDTYPNIKDQRFYGFKQLNLNNNFEDLSLMREKVAGDLFRAFGVPSAKSAFYEVYINNGNQSQYFGLYTMVEEVDNTVIKTQFANGDGNLYKPEGSAASFASGSYNTAHFYKKTNEDPGDWSDIKALYEAINNSIRTSDPMAWRTLLESKINMELYIKWLAANTVMQNWDTYGRMTHNYYLYNDPTTLKFVWIPWDNNEALQTGKMGGGINLTLSGINSQWPLISYIATDPVYYTLYKKEVKDFASTVFTPSQMYATFDKFYNLIKASAAKEITGYTFLRNGISDFNSAITQLKLHADQRNSAVTALN
jgi:hypothetical protein